MRRLVNSPKLEDGPGGEAEAAPIRKHPAPSACKRREALAQAEARLRKLGYDPQRAR